MAASGDGPGEKAEGKVEKIEGARMAIVFSGVTLTTAAASARDASEGLFSTALKHNPYEYFLQSSALPGEVVELRSRQIHGALNSMTHYSRHAKFPLLKQSPYAWKKHML